MTVCMLLVIVLTRLTSCTATPSAGGMHAGASGTPAHAAAAPCTERGHDSYETGERVRCCAALREKPTIKPDGQHLYICEAEAATAAAAWTQHSSVNCYPGHGAKSTRPNDAPLHGLTLAQCEAQCSATPPCSAIVVQPGNCWFRSDVQLSQCVHGYKGFDTYVSAGGPSPPSPPSPPGPPSPPLPPPPPPPAGYPIDNFDGENPLGIKPSPKRSDNYFLVIGDWVIMSTLSSFESTTRTHDSPCRPRAWPGAYSLIL